MAQSNRYDPAKSSNTRLFITEWRSRIDRSPSYQSCWKLTAVSKTYGDVTPVEMPDPVAYDGFIEVGAIRGTSERATATIVGRYALKLRSELLRMAEINCPLDAQLHMGACVQPDNYDDFDKALVLEDILLPDYSTDDLGALESGERAMVNETLSISARNVYEVVPLTFGTKASSEVTNEVLDVAICDTLSCGDCEDPSDGCQKIYAISKAAGGSPSTPADVIFSIDGASNWYAHDIDTLDVAEDPSAVDCLKGNLVVISNTSASLHYVDLDDLNSYTDPAFTEVTTGFVGGGEPNDIYSLGGFAFVVGDGGYVYKLEDAADGVSVLDAGNATVENLLCVHAMDTEVAIAGAEGGIVIYTTNGEDWSASPTNPVGVGNSINTVMAVGEKTWVVGASDGNIYYTTNGGNTWTMGSFPGSGSGSVHDLVMATDSVWYLAHATTAPLGRILRSYNAGKTWKVLPEKTGSLTANDRINRLAPCLFDPNVIVGVGLADDDADGFITYGSA